MGGPPAWDTKLVKPEVAVKNAPSHLGGGGLSGRGGKSRRCVRNSRVKKPTIPATTLPSSRLNKRAPISVLTRPKGNRNFRSLRSKSMRKAGMRSDERHVGKRV